MVGRKESGARASGWAPFESGWRAVARVSQSACGCSRASSIYGRGFRHRAHLTHLSARSHSAEAPTPRARLSEHAADDHLLLSSIGWRARAAATRGRHPRAGPALRRSSRAGRRLADRHRRPLRPAGWSQRRGQDDAASPPGHGDPPLPRHRAAGGRRGGAGHRRSRGRMAAGAGAGRSARRRGGTVTTLRRNATVAWAIARKDALAEVRGRQAAVSTRTFAALVLLLFGFALGSD